MKIIFWIIVTFIFIVIFTFLVNYLSIDSSAYCTAETLHWKNEKYTIFPSEPSSYEEGRNLITTSDGYDVNEVVEDSSHTFVVVRSFLDNALYVKEDYTIPKSGRLSFISWNRKKIVDKEVLKTVLDITKNAKTDFKYKTEAIFVLTDNQYMKPLYFSYEGCPLATNFMGYMGIVSGKWVITTHISKNLKNISVSVIPKKAVEVLSPFLKIDR